MIELWKFVFVVVCAGFGAYFGSYLKRKGENLATQEDIDKVLEQVSAVTKTTKEIEAKISDDLWNRQKHWEMKREVLFEAIKQIALVRDRLGSLTAVYQTEKDRKNSTSKDEQFEHGRRSKVLAVIREWSMASDNLEQTSVLLGLVCRKELLQLVLNFSLFQRTLGQEIMKGKPEAFSNSVQELTNKMRDITTVMREEMGLEKFPVETIVPSKLPLNQ